MSEVKSKTKKESTVDKKSLFDDIEKLGEMNCPQCDSLIRRESDLIWKCSNMDCRKDVSLLLLASFLISINKYNSKQT